MRTSISLFIFFFCYENVNFRRDHNFANIHDVHLQDELITKSWYGIRRALELIRQIKQ